MKNRNGIKWNREETILAFELYCRTPFSKISQSNKDIIELSKMLGRTPGSVGLKMHNLAHFNPELRARNISAMAHGSRLDEEVWREFSSNWQELSYQANLIMAQFKQTDVENIIDISEFEYIPVGKYKESMVKCRVGQYFFRMSVLSAYNNKCCITGLNMREMLIASHIKPWKDSDEKNERANPSNGLCLNAFHDKAFNKGLITIDKRYRIIISTKIKNNMDEKTKSWFDSYRNVEITLPTKFLPGKDFIEYHNDKIFLG